jgi:YedE family putative selenium metabolism protein
MKNFFASKWGIVVVGLFIGSFASLLQYWGNPGNMGICVACFERDIAGAVGLHRAAVVQYLRPEIIAFVLGSLLAALLNRDFRPRAGSAPIVRFVLGAFAMIGALIFLGCPWRALLRLAGGDLNAFFGVLGLVAGVWIGAFFFKSGYNLGRSQKTHASVGLLMPLLMAGALVLLFVFPQVPGKDVSGVLWYSLKGPGSQHAPIALSLLVGLAVGFLAQRSRFCTMGAFRDLILFKQTHLLSGVFALFSAALVMSLILGQSKVGFDAQPVAHTLSFWNFAGMVLAGLAFALAGGCPGRQLFMAGEGDGDAAVFVLGMIVGAGFSHNFGLASSPQGLGPHGIAAWVVGMLVCLFIGFTMRKKA